MTDTPRPTEPRYGDDDGDICPTCRQTVGATSPVPAGLDVETLILDLAQESGYGGKVADAMVRAYRRRVLASDPAGDAS